MIEEEVPSVNPKLDAMCEMLKTIHDLKEYENKCLAQKIQYIKELQEEIADLETQIEKMKCYLKQYHYDIYEYMQVNVIGE